MFAVIQERETDRQTKTEIERQRWREKRKKEEKPNTGRKEGRSGENGSSLALSITFRFDRLSVFLSKKSVREVTMHRIGERINIVQRVRVY